MINESPEARAIRRRAICFEYRDKEGEVTRIHHYPDYSGHVLIECRNAEAGGCQMKLIPCDALVAFARQATQRPVAPDPHDFTEYRNTGRPRLAPFGEIRRQQIAILQALSGDMTKEELLAVCAMPKSFFERRLSRLIDLGFVIRTHDNGRITYRKQLERI